MKNYSNLHGLLTEKCRSDSSSNLFFLIDQAALPEVRKFLNLQQLKWRNIFVARDINCSSIGPVLFVVGTPGSVDIGKKLLKWIDTNAKFTSSLIFIESPLSLNLLADRLRTRLDVRISSDMEAMLRFFDPRVLEGLIKFLPAEESKIFLSVAKSWAFFDRAGTLISIDSNFSEQDDFVMPLMLNEKLEFQLLAESEIDQILDIVSRTLPLLFYKIDLSERFKLLERAVECAKDDGVNSVYQFSLFVSLYLIMGDKFIASAKRKEIFTELLMEGGNVFGK